ncbi:MAG TPA: hypothetical protein VMJ72_02450 [Candidatus Paceibacterota bacterium]|nr:hypothetical protein [Candidatus Paceibacterota bacterium]
MGCSVAAFVEGRRIVLEMPDRVYDEFLDRRHRLGWTLRDMISVMLDNGFINLTDKPGEDDVRRFLVWLDGWGVRQLPMPRIASEQP